MPKKNKGITLISLVVTIIILIILAGVSIYLISGSSGILGRATASVDAHNIATAKGEVEMKIEEYATEYYDAVYVNKTENSTTQKGDWIYENYGNKKIKTKNCEFTITVPEGKGEADVENPYVVVIFENRRLSKKVTGTLSVEGVLNWEEVEIALPNDKEENPGDLPENTPETDAGTEVALKDGWYTETPVYLSTDDGKVVKESVRVANVFAVSDGAGNTVPVPKGFYYVGGTLTSGVVISDNAEDKNKYANDADGDIPKDLSGNQFVWIPVTAENYKKVEWKLSNGNNAWNAVYDTSTTAAELPQIQKYGGFYIARYEAGKGTVTSSSNVAIGSNITNSGWMYSGWSVNNYVISGKISSKADEIPYYHADYETAVQMANNMYQTEYVQSGLVTGTMWDAMMNFIGSSNVSSTSWGNYLNTEITLASGKYRIISSDGSETSSNVWTDGTGFKTNASTRYLLTTGSTEEVKKKNLYDVAGNLYEWSQEASYPGASRCYMLRGACFSNSFSDRPACWRGDCPDVETSTHSGFRPVLYIK